MPGEHSRIEKWRLFFAFWPTDSVRQAISDINHKLAPRYGRPVSDQNLHLTLVFLGSLEKSRVDDLVAGVADLRTERMTLQLGNLQWWRSPRLIALLPDTVPGGLLHLHTDLTNLALGNGIPVDRRRYLPHVTLRRKVNSLPQWPPFTPVDWNLQKFSLVRSVTDPHRAQYEVIWQSR